MKKYIWKNLSVPAVVFLTIIADYINLNAFLSYEDASAKTALISVLFILSWINLAAALGTTKRPYVFLTLLILFFIIQIAFTAIVLYTNTDEYFFDFSYTLFILLAITILSPLSGIINMLPFGIVANPIAAIIILAILVVISFFVSKMLNDGKISIKRIRKGEKG